jgi:hypothetical protein
MVQLEFDFNEKEKQQTAVDYFKDELIKEGFFIPGGIYAQAKEMEEQRLRDAIMYALDEDGHTGEWKIKFANNYINNLKQTK